MTQQLSEIRRILSTIFSIQTGLSDAAASEMFQRALSNVDRRRKLEEELNEAFSCRDTPWRDLICNDQYEVFEPGSE